MLYSELSPKLYCRRKQNGIFFSKRRRPKKRFKTHFLVICIIRHFEEKYKKAKNIKRYSLAMIMKPVPTIFDPKTVINKNSEKNNVTSPIIISRRSPRKRLYQKDQCESFISKD